MAFYQVQNPVLHGIEQGRAMWDSQLNRQAAARQNAFNKMTELRMAANNPKLSQEQRNDLQRMVSEVAPQAGFIRDSQARYIHTNNSWQSGYDTDKLKRVKYLNDYINFHRNMATGNPHQQKASGYIESGENMVFDPKVDWANRAMGKGPQQDARYLEGTLPLRNTQSMWDIFGIGTRPQNPTQWPNSEDYNQANIQNNSYIPPGPDPVYNTKTGKFEYPQGGGK